MWNISLLSHHLQDTIRNNITYGLDAGEVTQQQIEAAAKAANAHDFIVKFGKGSFLFSVWF